MKHNLLSKTLLVSSVLAISSAFAFAQCNVFVKKKCMFKVQPFTQNGQMNTSNLQAGKTMEVNLTVNAGQDYRILVCSEEILGEVSFKVMDMSRKLIFDSKTNDFPDFWDFKAKSTQQLIVEVNAPASTSSSSVLPTGCVSVMVGFKKSS
jgi:hypothetical protein